MALIESLLTAREVAKLAKVSERTVWQWLRDARIPAAVRCGSRCVRWRASDVDRWMRTGCPDRAAFDAARPAEGGR